MRTWANCRKQPNSLKNAANNMPINVVSRSLYHQLTAPATRGRGYVKDIYARRQYGVDGRVMRNNKVADGAAGHISNGGM